MVNNSTDINKTNNHLSPQLIEHKNKNMTYDIGNLSPYLGKAQKCGRVKLVNGIPTLATL